MKKRNYLLQLFVIIGATLFAVSSCLKDDTNNCADPRGNVRLLVKLDTETTRNTSNDRYQIDNVTLCIFDKNERFLDYRQAGAYIPGEEYEFWLNLEPDEYQFVIWTNSGETYKISHSWEECYQKRPLLWQMELYLDCNATATTLSEEIPDLHHGIYWKATVVANQDNEFTMTLTPNTYKLNFTIEGLPVSEHAYTFAITDNNSHYSFENNIVPNTDDFTYIRSTGFLNNELKASFKVLRLENDRKTLFGLTDNTLQENLYSNDVVQLIRKAYEVNGQMIDFSQTFEFDIKLIFRADMSVIVSINGWNIIHKPGELW